MENNLIYLNGEYYLLSDEEIKEDDWYLNANGIFECDNLHSGTHEQNFSLKNENNLLKWNTKILASTSREKEFNNFLLLSNIEEVIGVVDVDRLAEETYRSTPSNPKGTDYTYNVDINAPRKRKAFIKGFNLALSLNKHKMFTEEQAYGIAFQTYQNISKFNNHRDAGKFIQEKIDTLTKPQTSWKVKIVKEENGIITIKKS